MTQNPGLIFQDYHEPRFLPKQVFKSKGENIILTKRNQHIIQRNKIKKSFRHKSHKMSVYFCYNCVKYNVYNLYFVENII